MDLCMYVCGCCTNGLKVLESFDLVFLSDWMYDDTQVDSMNALFPVRQTVDYDSKVRGNYYQRVKLTPVLAADEVRIIFIKCFRVRIIFVNILL
jgi:hypothetical protein